ncbi:hypothetical protein H112_07189 [Trichophyton rubrum D6]|uniref:Homologous-pairing protein 2 winged helix domain-containing protein n=2 Tax=Trichophyton TaxID=5550 RepID=A0A022VT60_TRIRU|nr:hypothetical protein H100_07214 [Trichophyton rubrum MR850]EZF38543.1 hypothetical protein H102_07174 [Trichophyton rubrum CBS 100081]EZF49255.1 hypothetical protein H103_07197 [Trichophyton rubrum CBS 288.86]EZF59947.1 hypothetical protein H104_07151 [Trichophyton rubrum CBS 289.86]EZF70394.1 hypothetical protein H105_07209 [Trichophyton soudanense CBS 452.61]EZF81208.1 hypothetical protein H110_07197 [Trichophyton rubrum MR1448]EZF91756.1 hypothetical protein H113_07250 [Trichophyton rub
MAPKKEKTEKGEKSASSEDGSAMILKYLKQQNRPYSAIDISANLHNKVTKAYTVKALKALHEQKLLECRVSGKQMVYHAVQEASSEATLDELAAMDDRITSLKEQLESVKVQEKSLKAELAVLNSRVSSTELLSQIGQLESRKDTLSDQLAHLCKETATDRIVTEEESNRVQINWATWKKHASLRKLACRELWLKCTEVLPDSVKSREELWESFGMEGEL